MALKFWNDDRREVVKNGARLGKTAKEIADSFNNEVSSYSVSMMAQRLGVKLKSSKKVRIVANPVFVARPTGVIPVYEDVSRETLWRERRGLRPVDVRHIRGAGYEYSVTGNSSAMLLGA